MREGKSGGAIGRGEEGEGAAIRSILKHEVGREKKEEREYLFAYGNRLKKENVPVEQNIRYGK